MGHRWTAGWPEGFDAQEVCEAFSRFNRDRRYRTADLCRSLGCAGHDRILIMRDEDRATRAILTLVCLLAIVPIAIAALFQIVAQELRSMKATWRAGPRVRR